LKTREELAGLYRELHEQPVLSVYIDASERDPAERANWRRTLERQLGEVRRSLADSDDRAAFDAAVDHVQGALENQGAISGRGWAGFATADGMVYGEALPTTLPALVRWERGIVVAPYLRALKQTRPVAAGLVDRRRARVFRFQHGEIQEVGGLTAETIEEVPPSTSKRAAVSSGVRGSTATDLAQRSADVAADRLRRRAEEALIGAAGGDGILVVGGIIEAATPLASALEVAAPGRVQIRPGLHLEMTPAELKEELRTAASDITGRLQGRILDAVLDQARAGGRACLGKEDTLKALDERRVDTLLLSRHLASEHPDLADRCVGAAFEQGAEVEELAGAPGERLDTEAGGIAARLRYRM
jgi:hypothetical protein